MAGGWVKLHRKLLDNPIISDADLLQVWVWCLMKASHIDRPSMGRGILRPGEFVITRDRAAAELNIHPSALYRRFRQLVGMGQIATKSNNRDTLISIVNWSVYQGGEAEETPVVEQRTNNERTTDEQRMNNLPIDRRIKEGEEGKNAEAFSQENQNHDQTPAELANLWCFNCTRKFNGRTKDDPRDMTGEFQNLIGMGIPAADLFAEIQKQPPERDRGEHFWEFKKRLLKAKETPGDGLSPIARAMKKAKESKNANNHN